MGRSVMTPSNAVVNCYRDVLSHGYSNYCHDCDIDMKDGTCPECKKHDSYDDFQGEQDWEYFVDGIVEGAQTAWPSFSKTDKWVDRECHVILENDLAQITVSQYCGVASISLVSRKEYWLDKAYYSDAASKAQLCDNFCRQIENKFRKLFGEYVKIGTASNGEAFFQKAA